MTRTSSPTFPLTAALALAAWAVPGPLTAENAPAAARPDPSSASPRKGKNTPAKTGDRSKAKEPEALPTPTAKAEDSARITPEEAPVPDADKTPVPAADPAAADAAAPEAPKSAEGDKAKAPGKDHKKENHKPQASPKAPHGGKDEAADADDAESDDPANAGDDKTREKSEGAEGPALLPDGETAAPFTPSREEANRNKLNALLPTGSTHKGVYYPSFRAVQPDPEVSDPITGAPLGVEAPMDSLFKSDTVTRLDEDHVQFDHAHWVQFDQVPAADGSPKKTMSLDIERGVYDMKNQILMTNQPVRIENQQFIIVGDSMLHDRVTGLTRLTGRVKMTFYQEDPAPAAPGKPASKPPQDSAASSAPTPGPAAAAPPPPPAKTAPASRH